MEPSLFLEMQGEKIEQYDNGVGIENRGGVESPTTEAYVPERAPGDAVTENSPVLKEESESAGSCFIAYIDPEQIQNHAHGI